MPPNLKLANLYMFWGLIRQIYNAHQSFPLYGNNNNNNNANNNNHMQYLIIIYNEARHGKVIQLCHNS